jgi:anthranilate phosphoribosyltransferase
MALVLKGLGCHHALVVHGEDGIDEITICGNTSICELKDGDIKKYTVSPENYGLKRAVPGALKGGDAKENAAHLKSVLAGAPGPKLDAVLLNAAAVLYAGDRVANLDQGIILAREAINSGRAMAKLEEFVKFSRSLG